MLTLQDYGYKTCATCKYVGSVLHTEMWRGEECTSCSDDRCYRCGSRNLSVNRCYDCGATDA